MTSPGTSTRSGRSVAQHGLESLEHPRGLLAVAAGADAQHVVGLGHPELLEEHLRHRPVVVLAGVDDHVSPVGEAPPQRGDHRRGLDEVRPRADDVEQAHGGRQRSGGSSPRLTYPGGVTSAGPSNGDATARVRAWRDATHAAVCDVVEAWAHGTVVRATRHPSYYAFNLVRVEDDPAMSVEALVAFADQALAGLEHRRVDFDLVDAADPLRSAFEARGWESSRMVWMRHEAALPPGEPGIAVEEVPYDAVGELRAAWHREDFPDLDLGEYPAAAREVALSRGARVLAVSEDGAPVAFAQFEALGATAEITHVYVHPEYRGAGRGTAMTRAAIAAASDVERPLDRR